MQSKRNQFFYYFWLFGTQFPRTLQIFLLSFVHRAFSFFLISFFILSFIKLLKFIKVAFLHIRRTPCAVKIRSCESLKKQTSLKRFNELITSGRFFSPINKTSALLHVTLFSELIPNLLRRPHTVRCTTKLAFAAAAGSERCSCCIIRCS